MFLSVWHVGWELIPLAKILKILAKRRGTSKNPYISLIMATIETVYLGGLRTETIDTESGARILTDAPRDNHGKGEAFSPSDLLGVSLNSCMLSVMGIAARTHDIDIDGATCAITKTMADNPRRISEIVIKLTFPGIYTDKEKTILERAAFFCPVYQSLNPALKKTVDFGWKK